MKKWLKLSKMRPLSKLQMKNKEIEWLLRDKYNGVETADFQADIKRLEAGEPLAYIIGWAPFLGAKIYLDSKPLIPRSETEYWVSEAIKSIKEHMEVKGIKTPKILDLCAGSGCIGIAVLKEIPESQVDFAEINIFHHSTIQKNILLNNIDQSRTHIFGGDLFENILNSYDAILSNPPYINPELSSEVEKSVSDYEPGQALYGGKHGIEIIRRILTEGPKHLKEGGFIYIEHEPEQEELLLDIAPTIKSSKDQFGLLRFSRYEKPSF